MIYINPYDTQIEQYIKYCFDYLNGKVNTFNNKAVLQIDWAYQPTNTVMAFSILPNRVFINPLNVARYCPDTRYYNIQLVELLIHELFHVDQIIQFKRVGFEDYKRGIESAVEKKTVEFIFNHEDELLMNLGVSIDDSYYKYLNEVHRVNSKYDYPYERRDLATHLWCLIDQYTAYDYDSTNMLNMIKGTLSDPNQSILLIFNNRSIIVSSDMNKNQYLDTLNINLMDCYDSIFNRSSVEVEEYDDENIKLLIKINNDSKKVMCNIIY